MTDEKPKINVSVGDHTDKTTADVLRALIYPVAEETGALFGDLIGLIRDPISRARRKNAERGVERVRATLKERSINPKDITPPAEEDLFLMLDGISLSGDESVRNLWADLFANSLSPMSGKFEARPYIETLRNFTGQDARLFDTLAVEHTAMRRLERSVHHDINDTLISLEPADLYYNTVTNSVRKNRLADLSGERWPSNLHRIGLVEPRQPYSVFEGLFRLDHKSMKTKLRSHPQTYATLTKGDTLTGSPENYYKLKLQDMRDRASILTVRLSDYGLDLAVACGFPISETD